MGVTDAATELVEVLDPTTCDVGDPKIPVPAGMVSDVELFAGVRVIVWINQLWPEFAAA